jgi:hypothetical protein
MRASFADVCACTASETPKSKTKSKERDDLRTCAEPTPTVFEAEEPACALSEKSRK